jgi:hypothetical protein
MFEYLFCLQPEIIGVQRCVDGAPPENKRHDRFAAARIIISGATPVNMHAHMARRTPGNVPEATTWWQHHRATDARVWPGQPGPHKAVRHGFVHLPHIPPHSTT